MQAKLRDGLQFLKKLTWKRSANIFANLGGYVHSRFTHNTYHKGLPISISIEPTTSCNLRCPECPSGLRSFTRPTGMLEATLYRKIIDELSPTLSYLIFYFQGEPYLHKDFFSLIKYASEKGIYTATSTNAHFLDMERARATVTSGLDRLIISIDGATQDTYESYRIGGSISKVLEGTKNIIAAKKELKSSTPHVIFQYLVVQPNEHQLTDIKNISKELGVDELRFKTAQIYDYANGNPLIPTKDEYSRYKNNKDGTYSIKNKLLDHCWKMWHSCVITWDGKIVPCCFDKDAHHVMGNLTTSTFKHLWNNENYQNFRATLLQSRSKIEMCQNCTEGTKIWA
jgi:radical SAM protein with 4Fe4S-binding SPASM domain